MHLDMYRVIRDSLSLMTIQQITEIRNLLLIAVVSRWCLYAFDYTDITEPTDIVLLTLVKRKEEPSNALKTRHMVI